MSKPKTEEEERSRRDAVQRLKIRIMSDFPAYTEEQAMARAIRCAKKAHKNRGY